SQKSEVRSQKSEVRSQKSEVRSQKSEVRGKKALAARSPSKTLHLVLMGSQPHFPLCQFSS
ncbi:hypothetical protein, partial [Microcoleus sp. S13_C3]|uniref:hypothetical protein n=1 Tax=Microcoleus sp. S13_C3 TaxID=3055409 RepID=UPI002FD2DEEF